LTAVIVWDVKIQTTVIVHNHVTGGAEEDIRARGQVPTTGVVKVDGETAGESEIATSAEGDDEAKCVCRARQIKRCWTGAGNIDGVAGMDCDDVGVSKHRLISGGIDVHVMSGVDGNELTGVGSFRELVQIKIHVVIGVYIDRGGGSNGATSSEKIDAGEGTNVLNRHCPI